MRVPPWVAGVFPFVTPRIKPDHLTEWSGAWAEMRVEQNWHGRVGHQRVWWGNLERGLREAYRHNVPDFVDKLLPLNEDADVSLIDGTLADRRAMLANAAAGLIEQARKLPHLADVDEEDFLTNAHELMSPQPQYSMHSLWNEFREQLVGVMVLIPAKDRAKPRLALSPALRGDHHALSRDIYERLPRDLRPDLPASALAETPAAPALAEPERAALEPAHAQPVRVVRTGGTIDSLGEVADEVLEPATDAAANLRHIAAVLGESGAAGQIEEVPARQILQELEDPEVTGRVAHEEAAAIGDLDAADQAQPNLDAL